MHGQNHIKYVLNIPITYSFTHLPRCEQHSSLSNPLYVCRLICDVTLSFTKVIAKSRPEKQFATDMIISGGEEVRYKNITNH